MDFDLTDDELAATDLARRFATATRSPPSDLGASTRDANRELADQGFFSLKTTAAAAAAVTELSRFSASLGMLMASGWLFRETLARLAAPPRAFGTVALGASGDAHPARLRADGKGASATLNGTVPAVVVGAFAEHALVATDLETAVIAVVELSQKGVARSASQATSALSRAPRASLELSRVPISVCLVLAEGSAALEAARNIRSAERILLSAQAVGLARRACDDAGARVQSLAVRPRQSTEFELSDMTTLLDAATLSVRNAVWLRDAGKPHALESAGAKLVATRAATQIVHHALGIAGDSDDTDGLRRAYLDARYLEMRDGPAAQVDTIAGIMLGE